MDGPLAPFGDADSLRALIENDGSHRALYQVFLQVRDAAAYILDSTTLADIARMPSGAPKKSKPTGVVKVKAPRKSHSRIPSGSATILMIPKDRIS